MSRLDKIMRFCHDALPPLFVGMTLGLMNFLGSLGVVGAYTLPVYLLAGVGMGWFASRVKADLLESQNEALRSIVRRMTDDADGRA